MKSQIHLSRVLVAAGIGVLSTSAFAQTTPAAPASAATPYKITNTAQFMGTGGLDYVNADSEGRRLYVARGTELQVYDLDTLKLVGAIPNVRAHGAAIDAKSGHAFASSNPITMFDTKTLAVIKTIPVQGSPDGMLFEPLTERVYVLSHSQPNVTVIDAKDGSIVGTIDLGGQPEQGQSDGKGHVYIDLEDKAAVAIVDANALKVTATYDISSKGATPAGLGLDAKNGILFAMCRMPAVCVIVNAADGKILDALPIGAGTDSGGFNPNTMEAFSSGGGGAGTLAFIKENSPTSFAVGQTVETKARAKTSTLDLKTNNILLITTEPAPAAATAATTPAAATPPAPATAAAPATTPAAPTVAAATPATPAQPVGAGARGGRGGRGGGGGGPAFLDIIVVGK